MPAASRAGLAEVVRRSRVWPAGDRVLAGHHGDWQGRHRPPPWCRAAPPPRPASCRAISSPAIDGKPVSDLGDLTRKVATDRGRCHHGPSRSAASKPGRDQVCQSVSVQTINGRLHRARAGLECRSSDRCSAHGASACRRHIPEARKSFNLADKVNGAGDHQGRSQLRMPPSKGLQPGDVGAEDRQPHRSRRRR